MGFLLHISARGLGNKEDVPPLLMGTLVPLYHRRNKIKKDSLVLEKESSEFYISALIRIQASFIVWKGFLLPLLPKLISLIGHEE